MSLPDRDSIERGVMTPCALQCPGLRLAAASSAVVRVRAARATAAAEPIEEREAAGRARLNEDKTRPTRAVGDGRHFLALATPAWRGAGVAAARIVQSEASGQRARRRVDIEDVPPRRDSLRGRVELRPLADPRRRRNGRIVDLAVDDLATAGCHSPSEDLRRSARAASPPPCRAVLDLELNLRPELESSAEQRRARRGRSERGHEDNQSEHHNCPSLRHATHLHELPTIHRGVSKVSRWRASRRGILVPTAWALGSSAGSFGLHVARSGAPTEEEGT
jgi:hypothetical protein